MALQLTWEAEDGIDYVAGQPPAYFNTASVGLLNQCTAVYADEEANEFSPGTIHVLLKVYDAGTNSSIGGQRHWKFDVTYGHHLGDEHEVFDDWIDFAWSSAARVVAEPNGRLWFVGLDTTPTPDTIATEAEPIVGFGFEKAGSVLRASDFTGRVNHPSTGFHFARCMAVDRAADLIWVAWNDELWEPILTHQQGRIHVYRYSTKALLHRIYTPHAPSNIFVNPDGFVWAVDKWGWLVCYSYEGVFVGAWQDPTAPLFAGTSWNAYQEWGWDFVTGRLLCVEASPMASGLSTQRVRGYTPQTAAAIMSPPIPKSVPRRYRATKFLVKVGGSSGEVVATNLVTRSGALTGVTTTDTHGDAEGTVTPTAATPITVTFEVP